MNRFPCKGDKMNKRDNLVKKYLTKKLDIETIAMRVAKEFKDGDIVNPPRLQSTFCASIIP